jgi:hypothetical protein
MNQLRSLLSKQIFLDASDYSGHQPLCIPLARLSSFLDPILPMLLPPSFAICAFLTCQQPFSKCTIMYSIGAVDNPVYVNGIQTPSRWPLISLRAA